MTLSDQASFVSSSTTARRPFSRWTWYGALLMAVALPCGCGRSGPERFAVSGQVTFDGAPIPDGEIVFTPDAATSGPVAAGRVENGAFDIPAERGPVAGNYSVAITAERPTGKKVRADIIGDATTDQFEQYIPDAYNARTTLTAEIAADRDDLDFTLSSGKAKP